MANLNPIPNGTPVELMLHGNPVMAGVIKSRRKVRSSRKAELFGSYEYYVVGEHFGAWWSSNDTREKQ